MYNDDIGKRLVAPKLGAVKHYEADRAAYEAKKKFDKRLTKLIEEGKV